ncbi:DUF1688-domain-containing protein [Hesseltinella vesiculosa]|uniref:DUF1688-domain-containing protein n=1 Tax=Hesseltinella vesiculosa TaxID=101127 RepID=A0A1X2GFZ8_9FUNG|nr:DUF1688-domain-containing protein [Hesseltinella vesiculosa]
MLEDSLRDPTGLITLREQCLKIQQLANKNQLRHFDVDSTKFQDMVDLRDYQGMPDQMPMYGQWYRFGCHGQIKTLLQSWQGVSPLAQTQRLVDLFVVASALDVESVSRQRSWHYKDPKTSRAIGGSQGIAMATLDLFKAGAFSCDPQDPFRVDGEKLKTPGQPTHFRVSLQPKSASHLPGLEDRLSLLQHIGHVLQSQPCFRGDQGTSFRPGHFIDYLLDHHATIHTKKGPLIPLETLWPGAMQLGELWARPEGDIQDCPSLLLDSATSMEAKIPFHKYTQWLIYSISEPMEKLLGATIEGKDLLTPVPDHWQGGLLLDTGFLTLKPEETKRGLDQFSKNAKRLGQVQMEVAPMFEKDDPVVIEWRALTVAYMDIIADQVRQALRQTRTSLPLSKFMEAGSYSVGKDLAEISRPLTQVPPIMIRPSAHLV